MEILLGLIIYLFIGYFVVEYRSNGDITFAIEAKKSFRNYTNKIFLWLPNLVKYLYIIKK